MAINNFGGKTTESEKTAPSEVEQKLSKSGPVNYILAFLLIGIALYGGFLQFDQGGIRTRMTELATENTALQTQIDALQVGKVEVSQNAAAALKAIEADEVRWSQVIEEVNKLLPQDASGNRLIKVLSYSGSGQGRIALNMVTQPEALPPFNDVAQIIATFNNSVFFKNAYVPAISKGSDDTGATMLSFVLNMDYEKQETGADNLSLSGNTPAVSTTSTTSPAVKVPRNN